MILIEWIIKIISKASSIIGGLYKYRHLYKLTGIVATRRFKKAQKKHRYAILVAARNEETVIGNLIDSVEAQDYPSELLKVFVVAHNCTDNTAQIARNRGAVCYERNNDSERTKGYALKYLVSKIDEEYGIDAFDGYFIFDADNLLKQDYITRMNESFDAGEKIVTSYRHSKNFGDNWISASYGIHWLRTVRNEHRARSLFHLATRIQGTGFLFSNELIKDGWNYVTLTEDRAFCADAVAKGYKISYNHDAIFYDEQPVDIKTAMRQRIRWAKGHLQAFCETGPKLFMHIFYTGGKANPDKNAPTIKKLINNIRLRFMSFDMLTVVFPRQLTLSFKKFIVYSLRIVLVVESGAVFGVYSAPKIFRYLFELLNISPPDSSLAGKVMWVIACALMWTLNSYINGIITATYIFIIEHKRIMKQSLLKKIWFCITFPLFDFIGKLSMCIALFIKVEWKAIPHNSTVNINDLTEQTTDEEKELAVSKK